MIENIVRTISGEDKPTITQRQERSIRKCISSYMLLIFSKLDPAITDTAPQEENDDMISDMIADAETPPQPNSTVDNCNIEIEHSQLDVTMGKIGSLLLVPPQKIQRASFGRQIAANGWTNCYLMRHMSMVCACTWRVSTPTTMRRFPSYIPSKSKSEMESSTLTNRVP
jgi:hypothetical protein